MRAVRSVNNNIAFCIDSLGNEVIAMGKGIGYGELPREVPLSQIDRTFYNVDDRYISALKELPQDVVEFSAKVVDAMRDELPYQLSPNLTFILADHLTFAIQRAQKNIRVRMPLSYDVEQTYPDEYRIARHIVRNVRKEFLVALPNDEAAAVAMNIVSAKLEPESEDEQERERQDDEMLEDVTEIVEDESGVTVDRSSFAFSRYATHMRYLFKRLHDGERLDAPELEGFQGMEEQYPQGVACVDKIARHLHDEWGGELSDDEKLYLVIHVSRICNKGEGR